MKAKMRYRGRSLRINDSYDNILCIYAAYEENTLTDKEKIQIVAERLIYGHRLYVRALPEEWKVELVERIMKQYVELPPKPVVRDSGVRSFDFWIDREYIYASFQADYGIDLVKEQGHLSWKKYIALFQGLSEGTKIREVMKIRMMNLPAYNGRNGKEIQELQELKSYYVLPVKGGGGQSGLDRLFSALEAQAVRNG